MTSLTKQFVSFLSGSAVKNLPANAGDTGSIPGLGRSPKEEVATHSSNFAGKPNGQRSLAGHSPQSHKESEMTE